MIPKSDFYGGTLTSKVLKSCWQLTRQTYVEVKMERVCANGPIYVGIYVGFINHVCDHPKILLNSLLDQFYDSAVYIYPELRFSRDPCILIGALSLKTKSPSFCVPISATVAMRSRTYGIIS